MPLGAINVKDWFMSLRMEPINDAGRGYTLFNVPVQKIGKMDHIHRTPIGIIYSRIT